QGAVGLSPEEGPHGLRAVTLRVHAEHDERGGDGGGARPLSRPALRADRDQGRRRGPRPLAVPDDPDRGEEARATGVRRRAGLHRPDRGRGARPPRRASRDEAGDVPGGPPRSRGDGGEPGPARRGADGREARGPGKVIGLDAGPTIAGPAPPTSTRPGGGSTTSGLRPLATQPVTISGSSAR